MRKLIITVLLTLAMTPTMAQQPSSRVQPAMVERSTQAITYGPRSGSTKVELAGTTLLPDARGLAQVSNRDRHIEIDARIERMQPASRFGREYLTYVMWAITPEGRAWNLGEFQLRDGESRIEVATDLPTFALLVTAEPYFAVSQPSDVVVMENVVDPTHVQTAHTKYQLLPRGAYLQGEQQTQASETAPDENVPMYLAAARNAVALARMAGADRHAPESLDKAATLLATVEQAGQEGKRGNDVQTLARQAVQAAEDARMAAVRRQQEAFAAEQRSAIVRREREALALTREAVKTRSEAEQALAEAGAAKRAAEDETQQARVETLRAKAAAAVAEQEKKALRERLRVQLAEVLETREAAGTLIMDVPDVLFDFGSARLTATAREKLARISGILAAHPDLHVAAIGHTDSVGEPDTNQRLSERRAESVLAYFVQQKVPLTAVDIGGVGEAQPVAPNDTRQGRQLNRRVEIIVTGDSIGVAESPQ